MKVKLYVRVARDAHGRHRAKVVAGVRPSHAPIYAANGDALPTVAFALWLNVEDAAFDEAERVIGEITVKADQTAIAAELE